MNDKILATAKTWAAFAGAIVTALVGSLTPDDTGYKALTILLAVLTAVAVYRVPNGSTTDQRGAASVAELAIAAFVVVCAVVVLVRFLG